MKKVLVVDDDESILDAVALVLEEVGYRVETTVKGSEIYAKIDLFLPDIILLDVLMSGQDGRTICKKLKASDSTKHIPVIMFSAHPSANLGAIESGADDFLPKPFEVLDLIKKIELNLSKYNSPIVP